LIGIRRPNAANLIESSLGFRRGRLRMFRTKIRITTLTGVAVTGLIASAEASLIY
jgi:hypothetical protein